MPSELRRAEKIIKEHVSKYGSASPFVNTMKMKVEATVCYKDRITKRTCRGSVRDIIAHGSRFVQHVFEEAVGFDLTDFSLEKINVLQMGGLMKGVYVEQPPRPTWSLLAK